MGIRRQDFLGKGEIKGVGGAGCWGREVGFCERRVVVSRFPGPWARGVFTTGAERVDGGLTEDSEGTEGRREEDCDDGNEPRMDTHARGWGGESEEG